MSVTVSLFVTVFVSVTVFVTVTVTMFVTVTVFVTVSVDPCDMLNNFCFHVYAQKSLLIAENCNAFFGQQPHHPIL